MRGRLTVVRLSMSVERLRRRLHSLCVTASIGASLCLVMLLWLVLLWLLRRCMVLRRYSSRQWLDRTGGRCIRRVVENVSRSPRASGLLGRASCVAELLEGHGPACHGLNLGPEFLQGDARCRVEREYPLKQLVALSRDRQDRAQEVGIREVCTEGLV